MATVLSPPVFLGSLAKLLHMHCRGGASKSLVARISELSVANALSGIRASDLNFQLSTPIAVDFLKLMSALRRVPAGCKGS